MLYKAAPPWRAEQPSSRTIHRPARERTVFPEFPESATGMIGRAGGTRGIDTGVHHSDSPQRSGRAEEIRRTGSSSIDNALHGILGPRGVPVREACKLCLGRLRDVGSLASWSGSTWYARLLPLAFAVHFVVRKGTPSPRREEERTKRSTRLNYLSPSARRARREEVPSNRGSRRISSPRRRNERDVSGRTGSSFTARSRHGAVDLPAVFHVSRRDRLQVPDTPEQSDCR